jgi:hypothetical protein
VLIAPTAIRGTAGVYLCTDSDTEFGDGRRAHNVVGGLKEDFIKSRVASPNRHARFQG